MGMTERGAVIMDSVVGEWISWLVFLAVIGIPIWKMFDKAGINKGWLVTLLFPFIGYVITLIVLAVSRWPNTRDIA